MNEDNSYSKINYYLRPNKQVERKIIIEILQKSPSELSKYSYIGMGSIYYYDFILFHKILGIEKLKSIDNKTTIKRFNFNKPYDFIDFEKIESTEYLKNHDWNSNKSIIWLDYDSKFWPNNYLFSDLSIIGKECTEDNFIFITVNAYALRNEEYEAFNKEYERYISEEFRNKKSLKQKKFPYLIQNIILNILKEKCEYNDCKFVKLCSFVYKDGVPMYTLGGVFSKNPKAINKIYKRHRSIVFCEKEIQEIRIPNITYKEKFYLDSKVSTLNKWIKTCQNKVNKLNLSDPKEKEAKVHELLAKKMEFEISTIEIENYVKNYRYFPQYYEGII